MAGPTLPSDAAETPSEDIKSKPKNAKTSDPKANNSMYKIKKAAILYTILWSKKEPLKRDLTIAFGWRALLNSNIPLLIITKCLTIFIPPEVEPAEPPKNIRPKNKRVRNGDHIEKSPVTNPVVVTTAITWKIACLKELSNFP